MKNAGKLLLSGGLIVVSGAYAWWHHSTETEALTPMTLALRQARQAAPTTQPAPIAQAAPPAPSTPPPVQTLPSDGANNPPLAAEPREKAATKSQAPQSDAALKEALLAGTPAPPPPPPVAAPPPPPPPEAAAPGAASNGHFTDGDFVGRSFDGEWGPVQVKIAVRGGNVVQVVCIEYPFHRERSAEISEYAIPILVEETIKTQDTKIDWVSQASYTSEQFQESLVSAMGKAGKSAADMMPDALRRMSIHRLVLYYLLALLALSEALCAGHILPYGAVDLAFSAIVVGAACWAGNWLFARVWAAKSSLDSVLITALILILIITPFSPGDWRQTGYAVFASLWAMAGKYMLTLRRRNIFNPAAFGVALTALALGSSVSWWVGGSLYLLPLVIAGGVLILAKMNVTEMILAFMGADLVAVALTSPIHDPLKSAADIVLHSMFFFFAFVMLSEPRTAPLGRTQRLVYGALVGILFAPEMHLGSFYTTPELALLAGNIFAALTYVQRRRAVANAA